MDGSRAVISLAGTWTLALDPEDRGLEGRWFAASLEGRTLSLPGTTDQAGVGYAFDGTAGTYPVDFEDSRFPGVEPPSRADRAGHLVRPHMFIGKAWYQRSVELPAEWRGRHLELRLERVLWRSDVWIDERYLGSCDSLVAEHRYDLGALEPGTHRLTLRVDNGQIHDTGILAHAYGPETQSRWNGIVGRLELIGSAPLFLRDVQAHPAPDRSGVRVQVRVANGVGDGIDARLQLALLGEHGNEVLSSVRVDERLAPGDQDLDLDLPLGTPVRGWSEFDPHRYRLRVTLEGAGLADSLTRPVGFRHLAREGRQLTLDGRRLFLRGTLDCCVFPRTGHPPMTVARWLELLEVVRAHGFNHVRFHSWCPPEAAFEAADRLGLYLAPEAPYWVDNWTSELGLRPPLLGQDPGVTAWLRAEIKRIGAAYGDHPSFAFFCIGNEFGLGSDWELVDELVVEAKERDARHLYNGTTARRTVPADDYWVTHSAHGTPARGMGPNHTDWDFRAATEAAALPLVAHETGQRPVFPRYAELLPKFTGVLRPNNLEHLRAQLEGSGLADRIEDFAMASARFQLLQYKAEHEAFHRTPDLAGYQLLMLGDFTGQSEALVGLLDPFLEPKGVVGAEEIRRWNAPTVVLARFEGFNWSSAETFTATVEVAHHGARDLAGVAARWSLSSAGGRVVGEGSLAPRDLPAGELTVLGRIDAPLDSLSRATALELCVSAAGVENRWTHWVYPPAGAEPDPGGVHVATSFDARARGVLERGGRVLLLAHGLDNDYAARTAFPSVYWSAGWWGDEFSSLGILVDPDHPALERFPTEAHGDWQWYELTEGATTLLLDGAPEGLRPIVQPVTDFHHNRLLAQLFEARVGAGRLMVCGYDIERELGRRHAPRQLRRSLCAYMESEAFEPIHDLAPELLATWLARRPPARVVPPAEIPRRGVQLRVKAAARLDVLDASVPWSRLQDDVLEVAPGFDWRVTGGSWKDAVGSAWHGDPLGFELDLPAGLEGTLYVHIHDWNELGRRGALTIEGRRLSIDAHAGAGSWLALEISAADTADGRLELVAEPSAGPNLMITELVFAARAD